MNTARPYDRSRLVLRTDALRRVEAAALPAPLMERAGRAAADVAHAMLAGRQPRVAVLAGPGNNGGDGFVVARWLRQWFYDVNLVFVGDPQRLPADAAAAAAAWRDAGGTVADQWAQDPGWGIVVDALFGIGLRRPPQGRYAELIESANRCQAPILALDVPSGLDSDTGIAMTPAIRASRTATFIALKPGLLTADGPDHAGRVSVHTLDVDPDLPDSEAGLATDWHVASQAIPPRPRNSHKGSFGTVAVVGGDDGMPGAAILAGRAALMAGSGKVYVALVGRSPPLLDWQQPELMLRAPDSVVELSPDALVVGPGLGTRRALPWLDALLRSPAALVADADLLNRMAADGELAAAVAARSAPTLATPHPAEAARLLGVPTGAVQGDRVGAALSLARRYRAATVLKGCGSVCAFPDGRWSINTTGNPGLASAGTGDTLAGIAGALLAQHLPPDAALLAAVALHGAAADWLVAAGSGPAGLTASELAPAARRLLNEAVARRAPGIAARE